MNFNGQALAGQEKTTESAGLDAAIEFLPRRFGNENVGFEVFIEALEA